MMMANPEMVAQVKGYRPIEQLIPAHWQSGSVQAADGTPLHYWRTGGDKPALVLLHGYQAGALTWLRAAKALESSYDVVMPDARAHGKSGGVEHGFSLDLLASDAAALVRALGLERPFVLGHSMGGDTALRLALDAPELVRALILEDPPLQPFRAPVQTEGEPPAWLQGWFASMRALKPQPHDERMATGLSLLPPGAAGWGEADYVPFVTVAADFNLDAVKYSGEMDYGLTQDNRLGRAQCPVLVLLAGAPFFGQHDPALLASIESSIREGRLVQVEGAGHFIHVDAFDVFVAAVRDFMASHK